MSARHRQAGFSIMEVGVVIIVLALGGLVGYIAVQQLTKPKTADTHQASDQPAASSGSSSSQTGVAEAPAIEAASDLDQSSAILDKTELDSSADTTLLDKELANF